jgi:hypothetical protein
MSLAHDMSGLGSTRSAILALVLILGKGVVESVTLGQGRINVGNLARCEQVRDFRAGKAVVCVSECLRYGL